MTTKRTLVFAASLLAVLAFASPARATDGFPSTIALHLDTAAPSCTVCHASEAGGRGTVTTPFGLALRARGLQPFDEASLKRALDALAAANTDSDADGTGDVAELKAGTDPNAAAGDEGIVPEYGCTVARGAGGAGGAGGAAALAMVTLVSRGLRRRVRRSR